MQDSPIDKLVARAREMRKDPTDAEALMWECLRDRRLGGFKFRRQHTRIGYILDFFCASEKLAVELDGDVHRFQKQADERRQRELENAGLTVLRFNNGEVQNQLERVLNEVLDELRSENE